MSIMQDVKDGIQRHIDKNYGNLNAFCASAKMAQGKVWKFLNGVNGMNSNALGEILDRIGAKITFPDEIKDRTRNCVFIHAVKNGSHNALPDPDAQDYKAVPLVDMPVAAGPGLLVDENIRSWVLVYNLHSSVRMKSNLIAVEIGRGQRSMIPTLHPLDLILVDLDDRNPGVGQGMFLIREPDGSVAVKRVSLEHRSGKTHLIFYSDNASEYPPTMYVVEDDYNGDIEKAIIGKVLWAWSDMTQK